VPLEVIRNEVAHPLAHPPLNLTAQLKEMKLQKAATKKRLYHSFTEAHISSLLATYFGERQKKAKARQEASSSVSTSLGVSAFLDRQPPLQSQSSQASSQSSLSSVPMTSLVVDNESAYLRPGELVDAMRLTDMPKGFDQLVYPQLTLLATNISNMYEDGTRSDYVLKKAITILLRIHLARKREEAHRNHTTR
jgi:hypothetical protein